MRWISLCQRLNSRQLTQIRAPEARDKSSAKREDERRRRESPPEAKGERSEPFAGGARDSAKRNRNQLTISSAKLLQRPHKLDKLQFLGL